MQNQFWQQQQNLFQGPSLQQDVSCDICIIGGGLVGVLSAWKLAKAGFHVILIEAKSAIGLGGTAFSTGKITAQHSAKLSKLPLDQARTYYQFNEQAIAHTLSTLPTSLYTEVQSYVYATTSNGKEQLLQEKKYYQQLNIPHIETTETELPFPIKLALGLKKQYQCNPVELLLYFTQQAIEAGATLYTNSRAIKIYAKQVELENGCHIAFNKLFVCTHYPITSFQNLRTTQLAIYRAYLTASPFTDLLSGQYISLEANGTTVRTAMMGEQAFLLYGGGNHRAGKQSAAAYYDRITHELNKYYDIKEPTYAWSAQDVQTATLLPFIEQVAENIWLATGFDKWGLSNSFGASELLLHFAQQQPHPQAHLFKQSWGPASWGKTLQSVGYISLSLVESYLLHANNPKCTHLGCKTNWNKSDQTWDCPCHGSRFSADGQVIEGPAVYPLKKDT